MDFLESLLREHVELMRLTSAMTELLRRQERIHPQALSPETAARLRAMLEECVGRLAAHELLEDRFLAELLPLLRPGPAAVVRAVRLNHDAVERVMEVLRGMAKTAEKGDSYSIRFALNSLVHVLRKHLDYEEDEAFPMIRRVAPAQEMERAAEGALSPAR